MTEQKLHAGFWVRLFAGLLDCLFLMPFVLALIYITGHPEFESVKIHDDMHSFEYLSATAYNSFNSYIPYIVSIIYITYFLAGKHQATWGKRIMGIYVGNIDGSKISTSKAMARAAASILTSMTLGLGFVIVIFTKEKIALHDFICQTRVFFGKK